MENIKVIIVDDHKLVTDCISLFLKGAPDVEVIGVAHSGKQALELLKKMQPDVMLVDISMPELTGIETTDIIKKKYPEIRIMILSMHSDYNNISDAIDAGADGYVPKDVSSEELIEAIKTIYAGKNYFHTSISDEIVKNYATKKKKPGSLIPQLTKRELEVLHLFAAGYNNNEIADKLFLSVRTIESHKNHILQKTNMKNSVELIKFAIKNKIIDL
ncbi:MAG: response regulator transcription factor [Bacteroidales bacterium]|nr:response regulator transcription factor [Bacteroidales bacterium]